MHSHKSTYLCVPNVQKRSKRSKRSKRRRKSPLFRATYLSMGINPMGINPMGINPMGINRENPYNLDECKNNKPSFKENSPCDRTWERKGTKFVGMPANNVTSMLNRELIEIMLPELCEKVMRLHLCYRLNQMQVFSTNNQLPRNKLPIIRMWGFGGLHCVGVQRRRHVQRSDYPHGQFDR